MSCDDTELPRYCRFSGRVEIHTIARHPDSTTTLPIAHAVCGEWARPRYVMHDEYRRSYDVRCPACEASR